MKAEKEAVRERGDHADPGGADGVETDCTGLDDEDGDEDERDANEDRYQDWNRDRNEDTDTTDTDRVETRRRMAGPMGVDVAGAVTQQAAGVVSTFELAGADVVWERLGALMRSLPFYYLLHVYIMLQVALSGIGGGDGGVLGRQRRKDRVLASDTRSMSR